MLTVETQFHISSLLLELDDSSTLFFSVTFPGSCLNHAKYIFNEHVAETDNFKLHFREQFKKPIAEKWPPNNGLGAGVSVLKESVMKSFRYLLAMHP